MYYITTCGTDYRHAVVCEETSSIQHLPSSCQQGEADGQSAQCAAAYILGRRGNSTCLTVHPMCETKRHGCFGYLN